MRTLIGYGMRSAVDHYLGVPEEVPDTSTPVGIQQDEIHLGLTPHVVIDRAPTDVDKLILRELFGWSVCIEWRPGKRDP